MNTSARARSVRSEKRRILIVDDHPITRHGLAGVINQQDDLVVCGEAADAQDAMRKVEALVPDLVVTDISLDGKSGLELVRDLRSLHPKLRLLVMTMHDETIYAERALRAGSHGYIMKRCGAEATLGAIRKVLSGKVSVSDKMSSLILERFSGQSRANTGINVLTDREFEVFKLIGEGCSTRDVAQRLHLSPKTIDVYRQHIKEKFGLTDSVSLVQYAVRWVETQDRV